MHVELIESTSVAEPTCAALRRCADVCLRALEPDEPTPPHAYFTHRLRHPGTHRPHRFFVAWDARREDILGYAETAWWDGTYSYMVEVDLNVAPDARRAGIGRRLVDAVADAARAQGRTSLVGSVPYDGPGRDFARALGAKFGLDEYRSRLFLDEAQLDVAPVAGCSLVRFTRRCPDEYAESFARLREVMNTTPQGGDITWPDDRWDLPRWRRIEANLDEAHVRPFVVVARDDMTGALVAMTEVMVVDEWPEVGEQGDTGVLAAYRGRGLAEWVKADMVAWLRTQCPRLRLISTWNAVVNEPMLRVNERLGYRDRRRWVESQLTL